MKIKSLIFFCFITAQSFLCAQQEPEGWVWMSLPWYYSPQDQSWFAMYPKGERLWVWNADEKYWNLKWSKSGWNLPFETTDYDSTDEVMTWAEATSRGGYFMDEVQYENITVLVVRRSFTWGLLTRDVSIFIHHLDQGWRSIFYKDIIVGKDINFRLNGARLIFEASPGSLEIFSINLDYLVEEHRPS